jgi:hypothetical protein
MAEPRRIDDDETILPDVAERRPPARDREARHQLLHNEPVRDPQAEPILLPESDEIASSSVIEEDDRNVDQRSRPAHAYAEPAVGETVSLFADADVKDYRSRWSNIQTAFVDEPRKAVEDADALVKSVLNNLSEVFTRERQTLANQWERGSDVSTEDLRITLRRYRSFFDRLLNV